MAKECVANQECWWTRHLFHFGPEECLLGKFSASILGDVGDFPLVSGVCLHMQRPAIADEPSEIRGTSSLWEYSVVGCAFMQQRIIFPLFMLPLWAYILFMNSWELASHVWLYVCIRVSAGNFFICRPQWLDSKIHPMLEPLDQPNMIDEFQNRVRPMNDCLLRQNGWWRRQTSYGQNSPVCLVIGGHFQLYSVSGSVFSPGWRCVSPPPPSPVTP